MPCVFRPIGLVWGLFSLVVWNSLFEHDCLLLPVLCVILAVAVEGIPTVDNVLKVGRLFQAGIGKYWNPEPRCRSSGVVMFGESRTQKK